ncbi:MAG: hypothetical protein ABJA74_12365 [Lapillicoccus sp.]
MADHEVPDLHDLEEKIHAAHDAEDRLRHTMPNAIQPDDEKHPGMTPPSATDEAAEENAQEQPEPEERDDDEAFVESTVVEDDSPPPGDPDHA